MAVPTLLLMETLKSPSTKNKSPWESHSQVYTNLCGLQSRKQVEITDLGFFFQKNPRICCQLDIATASLSLQEQLDNLRMCRLEILIFGSRVLLSSLRQALKNCQQVAFRCLGGAFAGLFRIFSTLSTLLAASMILLAGQVIIMLLSKVRKLRLLFE